MKSVSWENCDSVLVNKECSISRKVYTDEN